MSLTYDDLNAYQDFWQAESLIDRRREWVDRSFAEVRRYIRIHGGDRRILGRGKARLKRADHEIAAVAELVDDLERNLRLIKRLQAAVEAYDRSRTAEKS